MKTVRQKVITLGIPNYVLDPVLKVVGEYLDRTWLMDDYAEIKRLAHRSIGCAYRHFTESQRMLLEELRDGSKSIWQLWSIFGGRVPGDDGRTHWTAPLWLRQVTKYYFHCQRQGEPSMQIERATPAVTEVRYPVLIDIGNGIPFRHPQGEETYIKVKQSYSQHIRCNPGECLAVLLTTGEVYAYPGNKRVVPVDAVVTHKGDLDMRGR